MFGLDFLPPHFLATSSGSVSLNSPLVPSQVMIAELVASESNSSKNCQSWICPEPWETKPRDVDDKRAYGSVIGKMSTWQKWLNLERFFHLKVSCVLIFTDANITRLGLSGLLAYPDFLPDEVNSAIITRERTNGAFKYTKPDEVPRK